MLRNTIHPPHPPYLGSPALRLAAWCVEPLYSAAVSVRNTAFDRGWRKVHRPSVPVISIGNLTTGGTGKTPTVVYVVQTLQSYGACPAVILRGYRRRRSGHSDEQELLRNMLPGTPVIAEPDRVAAARKVEWEHAETDVIVLDDGFQHRRLRRDLDLVLIDATNPFGYGHVLPRGLLRERPSALHRADAVVVTHADLIEKTALDALDDRIASLHGRAPIAHTAHTWSQVVDSNDQPINPPQARVSVLIGLGNPEAFLEQAAQRFTIAGAKLLPDHADYDRRVVRELRRELEHHRADAVLTSEKDWVKLRPLLESHPLGVPVWRPKLCIAFIEGEKAFDRTLLVAVKTRKVIANDA